MGVDARVCVFRALSTIWMRCLDGYKRPSMKLEVSFVCLDVKSMFEITFKGVC